MIRSPREPLGIWGTVFLFAFALATVFAVLGTSFQRTIEAEPPLPAPAPRPCAPAEVP